MSIAVISSKDVLPKSLEALTSGEQDLVSKAIMFVNNLTVHSKKKSRERI